MEKWAKEMAVRFQNRHHQSETRFQPQKTQNSASEMNLKTASLGGILTQNTALAVDRDGSPVSFKIQTEN